MRTSQTACEKFYGLRSRAFSLTPDLRFVYHSHSHTRAVEQVTAALRRREGLVVVTGEVGTGKTMLCRTLLETFETRTFQSVILDPLLTVEDLLYQVLTDFGLVSGTQGRRREPFTDVTRHNLVATLQQFLASLIPLDAHAVIMIDEAQHLGPHVLEEIRLLSNFETDQAKLLQIVLVGQPNLDGLLRRPDMRQLNQRVARRCELEPLTPSEVSDYVQRRLAVASEPPPGEPVNDDSAGDTEWAIQPVMFTREALDAVATISQGIPRVVNTLCDRALEAGFERGLRAVDVEAVLAGAAHLKLPVPTKPTVTRGLWKLYAAAAVLVILAIISAWWWSGRAPSTATGPAAASPSAPAAPVTAPPTNAPATPAAAPSTPTATAQTSAPSAPVATTPPAASPSRTTSPSAAPSGAAAAPTGAERYQIVVAAFRTEQRATEVAEEIKAAGVPVAVRLDTTGRWYSLVAGPYRSSEDAQAAQNTLASQGFWGTRISQIDPAR